MTNRHRPPSYEGTFLPWVSTSGWEDLLSLKFFLAWVSPFHRRFYCWSPSSFSSLFSSSFLYFLTCLPAWTLLYVGVYICVCVCGFVENLKIGSNGNIVYKVIIPPPIACQSLIVSWRVYRWLGRHATPAFICFNDDVFLFFNG